MARAGTVLDAAARVEQLELGQQVAVQVAADAVEAHQRGVADEVHQPVGHLHRAARVGGGQDPHAVTDGSGAGSSE